MASFSKVDILRSLYEDNALPPDKQEILKSLEEDGQLDAGLMSLSKNKAFIQSLTGGATAPAAEQPAAEPKTPAIPAAQPSQPTTQRQLPQTAPSLGQFLVGAGELGLSGLTGALSEPIAGLAGLAKTITSGPEAGAQTIEEIRRAGTYRPRTESAKQTAMGLGQVAGELISPVAEPYGKVVTGLSGLAGQVAGPEAAGIVGSIGQTAPAAGMEYLGLKGAGKLFKAGAKPVRAVETAAGEIPSAASITEGAKRIGKGVTGRRSAMEGIAAQVEPDKEILKAAREFGMENDLLPSHYSQNPVYRAVEQGLASMPGSELAATQKRLLGKLGERADKLIEEFGGMTDKTAVSDKFKTEMTNVIDDLDKAAGLQYDIVSQKIPKNTIVKTDNIRELIQREADDLGGIEYLEPEERRLFKQLDPETNPTYARLDKIRKDIGATMRKKSDIYKNVEEGRLKRLYGALAKDQKAVAEGIEGAGEAYQSANALTMQRKGLEEKIKQTLGKDIMGNITTKAKPAILNLQKGQTKEFDNLMSNIPDELGSNARKEIIATSLNDAFTQGSRKYRDLNVPGFDDWMTGIKRNKTSVNRLKKELGEKEWNRLDSFHNLVSGARKAMEDQITTGRSAMVPRAMDEVGLITKKLYGAVDRIPVVGGIAAKPTATSVAADRVMSSPSFNQLVRSMIADKKAAKTAEKAFMNTPAYQSWQKSLNRQQRRQLETVGVIGYLTSPMEEEE